jgi:hypothetical protein
MDLGLQAKRALVTGTSAGIGAAIRRGAGRRGVSGGNRGGNRKQAGRFPSFGNGNS